MSIRSQARADFDANLTADGDDVTFTIPDSDDLTVKGKVARIDSFLDPQLGIQIKEPRTAVTVSMSLLPSEPDDTWTISTTDSEGNALSAQVGDFRMNRTLGYVTFMLEMFE